MKLRPVTARLSASPVTTTAGTCALVGLLLLGAGLWRATGGRPPATVTVTLPATVGTAGAPAAPVVVSGDDLPDDGAPAAVTAVQVEAFADPAVPVFVGIGRRNDVDDYLGAVARCQLGGDDLPAGSRATTVAGESRLPDPASVDVWAAQVQGPGRVMLSWPRTKGRWRLVAATDGAGPAPRLRLTYRLSPGNGGVPLLLAGGTALVVVGGAVLLVARRREVPA
jgi:hypothetical protein